MFSVLTAEMKLIVSLIVVLVACAPVRAGDSCHWNPKVEQKQSLAPDSLDKAQIRRFNVADAAQCQRLCCDSDTCDLALFSEAAQCDLVQCPASGCRLEPSGQFRVFSRLRIVPYTDLRLSQVNTSHCLLPVTVGRCRASFPRFYYDAASRTCRRFTYGGCSGNNNNFVSQEDCEAQCGGVTEAPASNKASSDECSSAPDPGPCRAAFTMFYYDVDSGACRPFVYGGCRGNMNRHGSMEACQSRCSEEGSAHSRGRLRNRWTAAFFLLLTLAGVSALLVAALLVITVRRRLPRGPPSLSDKQELLQDPDEPALDSPTEAGRA